MRNYAGHRLAPWLAHAMVSRQETARALLTPGEVMQLPATDELVLISGPAPIRAHKLRYVADVNFTARVGPAPALADGRYADCPKPRSNDWGRFARLIDARLEQAIEPEVRDDDGGMQQQRHPGNAEETEAKSVEQSDNQPHVATMTATGLPKTRDGPGARTDPGRARLWPRPEQRARPAAGDLSHESPPEILCRSRDRRCVRSARGWAGRQQEQARRDALAAWLAQRGAKEIGDLFKARLGPMSRELATVHANSAASALCRIEQLVQAAVITVPRWLIAEAIDMIVFIRWMPVMRRRGRRGGSRACRRVVSPPAPRSSAACDRVAGLRVHGATKEAMMIGHAEITDGAPARAIDEPVAGTGPGVPHEAPSSGADLPEPPGDEEVARIARKLGAPDPLETKPQQPAGEEAEAHPS